MQRVVIDVLAEVGGGARLSRFAFDGVLLSLVRATDVFFEFEKYEDRDGNVMSLGGSCSLSPDGRWVAVGRRSLGPELLVEVHDTLEGHVRCFGCPIDWSGAVCEGNFARWYLGDVLFVSGAVATLVITWSLCEGCGGGDSMEEIVAVEFREASSNRATVVPNNGDEFAGIYEPTMPACSHDGSLLAFLNNGWQPRELMVYGSLDGRCRWRVSLDRDHNTMVRPWGGRNSFLVECDANRNYRLHPRGESLVCPVDNYDEVDTFVVIDRTGARRLDECLFNKGDYESTLSASARFTVDGRHLVALARDRTLCFLETVSWQIVRRVPLDCLPGNLEDCHFVLSEDAAWICLVRGSRQVFRENDLAIADICLIDAITGRVVATHAFEGEPAKLLEAHVLA